VPRKHIQGAEVQIHSFLTLALVGDEWFTSCPSSFTSHKEPPLYPHRADLNVFKKRIISCPYWDLNPLPSSP